MIQVDETVKNRLGREVRRVNRFIETLRRGRRSEEMESGGDNTPLSDVVDATQMVEEKEIARMGGGCGRDEESRHQEKESLQRSRAL